jgi:hypothetical protein
MNSAVSGRLFAQSPGAQVAGFQPQDDVRVMLDPAGHPFCLYTAGPSIRGAAVGLW